MGAVINVTWASPSLDQIEELVNESIEALDELHSMPADHPLRILAAQCRAAVVASRRLSFGPFAQRALTEKALRVKVDALMFLRSQLAEEGAGSGTIPKGTRAWPEEEREDLEKSEVDPSTLPSDQV